MPKQHFFCRSLANITHKSEPASLIRRPLSNFCFLLEADLTSEKLYHSTVSILPSFLFECELEILFLMSLIPLNILMQKHRGVACFLLCTYSPVKTKQQAIKILVIGIQEFLCQFFIYHHQCPTFYAFTFALWRAVLIAVLTEPCQYNTTFFLMSILKIHLGI